MRSFWNTDIKMESALSKTPHLSLPLRPYADHIRQRDGKLWDPTRKLWLVAEPEEVVRQTLILYLQDILSTSPARMKTEPEIRVQSMRKRLDLVLYDGNGEPFLLAECKAWSVPIDEKVLQQIGNYNTVLKAPFLLLTNGKESLLCHSHFGARTSEFVDSIDFLKNSYEDKR